MRVVERMSPAPPSMRRPPSPWASLRDRLSSFTLPRRERSRAKRASKVLSSLDEGKRNPGQTCRLLYRSTHCATGYAMSSKRESRRPFFQAERPVPASYLLIFSAVAPGVLSFQVAARFQFAQLFGPPKLLALSNRSIFAQAPPFRQFPRRLRLLSQRNRRPRRALIERGQSQVLALVSRDKCLPFSSRLPLAYLQSHESG